MSDQDNGPRMMQVPTPEQLDAETMPVSVFFNYAHLPPHLRAVSEPFAALACHLVATLARSPERSVALRKLLEAKDAAVRQAVLDHRAASALREAGAELGRDAIRDPEPMLPDNSQAVEAHQRWVAAMSDPDRE